MFSLKPRAWGAAESSASGVLSVCAVIGNCRARCKAACGSVLAPASRKRSRGVYLGFASIRSKGSIVQSRQNFLK